MQDLVRRFRDELQLSAAARAERRKDARGLPRIDPGIDRCIGEGLAWLGRAQDRSLSADGGVARHYSLLDGWSTSYPETTGYIVPTLIECAERRGDRTALARAGRMLDWLAAIQLPDGGFQGGRIDLRPVVPVTFNTGQIVLGLAAGMARFGAYEETLQRAAGWLVATQDDDGGWSRYPSPFAGAGEKTYDTHVAWGLFEADRVLPGRGYGEAGLRQVRWALTRQRANGWIESCCLDNPQMPLTHTLGYALRGIIEAYRWSGERLFLDTACRTADGLLTALGNDGYLPGRLTADWQAAVDWTCLTGSAQIAHGWLILYELAGNASYREAGFAANAYVRRTVAVDGPLDVRGGVKGAFPVNGGYGTYQYLNWAVKFAIDSNLCEQAIRAREQPGAAAGFQL